MPCPHCQRDNPAEANFCLHCGTKLAQRCPNCQQVLPSEAKFCMACGQALSPTPPAPMHTPAREPRAYTPRHLVDKILTSRSALEGERKQVSVLFADTAGFTTLA